MVVGSHLTLCSDRNCEHIQVFRENLGDAEQPDRVCYKQGREGGPHWGFLSSDHVRGVSGPHLGAELSARLALRGPDAPLWAHLAC